jgi:hypothetical protein
MPTSERILSPRLTSRAARVTRELRYRVYKPASLGSFGEFSRVRVVHITWNTSKSC